MQRVFPRPEREVLVFRSNIGLRVSSIADVRRRHPEWLKDASLQEVLIRHTGDALDHHREQFIAGIRVLALRSRTERERPRVDRAHDLSERGRPVTELVERLDRGVLGIAA